MRTWVYGFDAPLPAALGEAKAVLGGKGASLKDMTRAGLHVPPGFTIITEACAEYYAAGRRWPAGLEEQVRQALGHLEQATGRTFGRGPRPLLVSVRSGAAQSMPGMMDTLLNCGLHPGLAECLGDGPAFWNVYQQFVRMFARTVHDLDGEAFASITGCDRRSALEHLDLYQRHTGRPFPTDPWDLLSQCVNAVFASWNSERAIAYRQHHDIRQLRGTAVNVQMMFPSEVSGIVFTQDPNDLAGNRMVIEASFGLGEAVVSGEVTPDRFLVGRDDPSRIETHLGHKVSVVSALGAPPPGAGTVGRNPDEPSLTPAQLAELHALCLKVERHFGQPVDIEFGWAEGRFALLQSRPIRGLEVALDVEVGRQEEIARLRALCNGQRRVWVTHNLGETLRAPTPLTWDIVRRFMTGDGGFGRLFQRLGYRPSAAVRRDGFLELICGRIYADPHRLAGLFWDGLPMAYDLEELVRDKSLLDQAPTRFDPDKADARFLTTLPRNLWGMWRSSRLAAAAIPRARQRFEEQVLPPFLQYVRAERARDLAALSDQQVLAELDQRRRRVLDEFGPESLLPGYFAGLAFERLKALMTRLMGPTEGTALANTLTRALEGDTTFEQDALLYRVAQGQAQLPDFLERFGHRCLGEMELSVPRWREEPSYLEQTVARMKAAGPATRSPERIHHENLEKRQAAEAALPAALAQAGGSAFLERIRDDLARARELLPYREAGKHYLMMGYELIRLAIEELARRWDLGGDIYFLTLEELPRWTGDSAELRETIARRRTRHRSAQRLDVPDVVDSRNLDGLGLAPELETSGELTGAAIASGLATGPARIVFDPGQAGDLGLDYILVCPSTDPGWTPLFLQARGLIVEKGGVLSHGAIVARDFGIPAVVCPNATRLLKNGDRIRVDGNRGQVVILEPAAADA